MQTMRDKWTDERLDDLNAKVDRGFERIERRIETEIQALRTEMNARFDAMNRAMLWFAGALVIAIVASNLVS
ncbi:MAG: hypothetical protein QOE75_1543 [Solirubrobacterales bacterium]|jgi:chaperonin cofactor prefoldin|nr:hypothetical protein [Solirubrobacterales bacterium]